MKKLFFLLISVMLSISAIRVLSGNSLMSVSVFLESVSQIDIDFSVTLTGWSSVAEDFASIGNVGLLESILNALKGVYKLLNLPVALVVDLLLFLSSVIDFASFLLGFSVA